MKICAICGAPYCGSSCPNCGSREIDDDDNALEADDGWSE